jgi:hypothetical protein
MPACLLSTPPLTPKPYHKTGTIANMNDANPFIVWFLGFWWVFTPPIILVIWLLNP